MPTPVGNDIRSLIINPSNNSLLLGLAHHAGFRPANAAFSAATGKTLWKGLDPAEWGAGLSRAGEHVDAGLGKLVGNTRQETLTLSHEQLTKVHDHMASLNPEDAEGFRSRFNKVVAKHYNPSETITSLLNKSKADPEFKATLHDVKVPSLTGNAGKRIKAIAADTAGLYGSAEIISRVNRAAKGPPEEPMDSNTAALKQAAENLEKAQRLLAEIPQRDLAYKQASDLLSRELIEESELDKYASLFFKSPDAVDVITSGLNRANPTEKSARLGDVVYDEGTGQSSGSSFDEFCRT